MDPKRRLGSIVVLGCSLALIGPTLGVGTATADDDAGWRGHRITRDAASHFAPSLARDAADPDVLALLDRRSVQGTSSCVRRISLDGGVTWSAGTLPVPLESAIERNAVERCEVRRSSGVAFDGSGTIWFGYAVARSSVYLVRTRDRGRSFSAPVRAGIASVPYTMSPPALLGGPDGVLAAWSDAAGVWLARLGGDAPTVPILIEPGARDPAIAADAAGNVVLASVAPEEAACTTHGQRPRCPGVVLARTVGDAVPGPRVEVARVPADHEQARLALVGVRDGFVAAWNDARSSADPLSNEANHDIFSSRSADGGATWSEAIRVSAAEGVVGFPQALPALAARDDGRIYAAWYDARNEPFSPGVQPGDAQSWDVYLAHSDDGGLSWKEQRITAESRRLVGGPGGLGMVVARSGPVVVWEDARRDPGAGSIRDLYMTGTSRATPARPKPPVVRGTRLPATGIPAGLGGTLLALAIAAGAVLRRLRLG